MAKAKKASSPDYYTLMGMKPLTKAEIATKRAKAKAENAKVVKAFRKTKAGKEYTAKMKAEPDGVGMRTGVSVEAYKKQQLQQGPVQRGKRGGSFRVVNGKKVYIKKH